MKRNTLILVTLILIVTTPVFAQNFQGKAYYQSKTTIDMKNFGGRKMSEDRKKQIAERMKSMFEKTYILTFNKAESVYKEEEKLEAPGGNGRGMMMMSSFTAGKQYKNVKEQLFLQDQEFFGKQFLIKDSLPQLQWKMENETKQIGKYTCFKATAIKKVDAMDFSNMRRKEKDAKVKDSTKTDDPFDEIEVPKEIIVTAWYTPQIPVSQGPGEYWGLPGLILEVNAGELQILCNKIVLNTKEEKIVAPTKGKEITQKEYDKVLEKKLKEMRENFRSKRKKGGNSHRGRRH